MTKTATCTFKVKTLNLLFYGTEGSMRYCSFVCLFVCQSVCLCSSVCLFVCPALPCLVLSCPALPCPPACLPVCLFLFLFSTLFFSFIDYQSTVKCDKYSLDTCTFGDRTILLRRSHINTTYHRHCLKIRMSQ